MGRLFPRQLARVRSPRYAGSSRIGWDGGGGNFILYWNVLLQPPLGKDPIEPWPQRPLGQDGEHHALQHQ